MDEDAKADEAEVDLEEVEEAMASVAVGSKRAHQATTPTTVSRYAL